MVQSWYQKYTKTRRDKYKKLYGLGAGTIMRYGYKLPLLVYTRDKYKCVICYSKKDLTLDHIDGNGRHNQEKGVKQNNRPDNLRVLCRKCHGKIDGKRAKGISKKGPK